MRILLISHQLGYSGAPIALLHLARFLKSSRHDVFLISLRGGPLAKQFADLSVRPHSSPDRTKYDLVIANTVLTIPLALNIARSSSQVFAWVHESSHFFKTLRVTPGHFRLEEVINAGFPSLFQFDEFRDYMPNANFSRLRNYVSMPHQFPFLGYGEYFSCTGQWEDRKNQKALTALFEMIDGNRALHFIGAIRPHEYTSQRHVFHGEVPHDRCQTLIANSKGLISAAISETQNLCAIEAMMVGVPVLLSDIPAHRELKDLIPDILLFDPSSLNSFLSGFHHLISQSSSHLIRNRYMEKSRLAFGPEQFSVSINNILKIFTHA